ncbi:TPA: hypothetical protein O8L89_004571, partial [Enterobacter cloacae]|nr:hypothetical protein [Enterobacter cloacae]
DFKTEHQGAGISSGGSIGKQFAGNMANALLAGGGNSGHAEGTTQAAVSEGTLIIRDKENQKQDVADLSRDAEHANGSISPIFDKEKEQQRLQEVQLIGEIGSQVVDIANTQGEINGLNAGRKELADKGITEPGADASDEVKAAYQNALRETGAYKTTTAKYGTGSDVQRGIQAATAALQGLAGSDLKAALAGASAPELAYRIGHDMGIDNNTAAKTIAHAILGGAGSGTGTPPPPENDPKQQNEKPVEKLDQKQESTIKKIGNTIKNALKDHDITGTIKDMDGNSVPKENGGYWDHMQEMQNTLRGLINHADTLKNVNNPEAQAAYSRATDAINKIESALKGHGI